MPALPSVPNVIRAAISGTKGSSLKNWANVLHWAYTGTPPTVSDLTAMAGDIATFWLTYMAPRQTSDTQMTMTKLTDLSGPTGAQVEQPSAIVGSNGEDPIPNQVAFLLDWPTTYRYRGGHPRTYLVVGGDGDLDHGGGDWDEWGSAFIAAVSSSWSSFTSNISGRTFGATTIGDNVAVRYRNAGAPLVTPIVLDLPTFNSQTIVATQRRRTGRK